MMYAVVTGGHDGARFVHDFDSGKTWKLSYAVTAADGTLRLHYVESSRLEEARDRCIDAGASWGADPGAVVLPGRRALPGAHEVSDWSAEDEARWEEYAQMLADRSEEDWLDAHGYSRSDLLFGGNWR